MDTLISDLRYAVRGLLKRPGFALTAVLTLALGVGANTAIFSVVNGVLLRPLPYRDPGTLTMVWEKNLPRHRDRNVVNPANYLAWRDRTHAFQDLAWIHWTSVVLEGDTPERVSGLVVSANLFRALGVTPALGRAFTDAENAQRSRVVILSDALWRRRFGADPGIIGRTIRIAGGALTVVGVMPPTLRPLFAEEFWVPVPFVGFNTQFAGRYGVVLGRLRPGVSAEAAQADLRSVATELEGEQPAFDAGWSVTVVPLTEQVVGTSRRTLWLLLGAVGMVLVIACANVGGLLMARASSQRHDTAVRDALGASRWRITRQRVVEGLVVALLGAGAGVLLATWGVAALKALAPADSIPRLNEVTLDGRALGVTLAVAVLAGLAFGAPAAFRRQAPLAVFQGTRTIGAAGTARVRSALVVAQLALAIVLLSGAGLLVQSVRRLLDVNPGFDPQHVLTASIQLPDTYPNDTAQNVFYDRLLARVRALPQVADAGVVSWLPLDGIGAATSFTVVGDPAPAPGMVPSADIRIVDSGYFPTLRIPMRRGRWFGARDDRGPPVVLVNETLARQMFAGRDAVGQRLKIDWWHPDATPEIVGVVGDVRHVGLDADIRPTIYYPRKQEASSGMGVVIRTTGDPMVLQRSLRDAVHELDPALPIENVRPLAAIVTATLVDRRYPMTLLGLFAGLAVALAAVGLYGVLAYVVGERTPEIGVRMALGASQRSVLGMVLRRGLTLAVTGVGLGSVAAVLAGRLLRTLLYDTAPADPLILATVAGSLIAVAVAAAWIPARRAAKTDPMVALRYE